jgi:hypothetical protein
MDKKTKPEIVAYDVGDHGIVHKTCLHLMQAPFRAEMAEKKTNSCPPNYPAVRAAWFAGHPSLPRRCCHCAELIEKKG